MNPGTMTLEFTKIKKINKHFFQLFIYIHLI